MREIHRAVRYAPALTSFNTCYVTGSSHHLTKLRLTALSIILLKPPSHKQPPAAAHGTSILPPQHFLSGKNDVRVAITGGAGQIAYALVPLIVHGRVFGEGRKVRLRLLDIEACAAALEGVAMEIRDCYSDLVGGVEVGANRIRIRLW